MKMLYYMGLFQCLMGIWITKGSIWYGTDKEKQYRAKPAELKEKQQKRKSR